MAKDPAVLFYTSDFLTGCALMSMAQRGKYITLLCLQHQQGHLSEEDMLEVCGSRDPKIWKKFKQDEDGLFYNERMEIEGERRKNFILSKVENGKKGGRPKKNTETDSKPTEKREETDSFAIAKATEKLLENENINENIYNYWNSKGIIKHLNLSVEINNAIDKALKIYTEEEIKRYIDRYATAIGDKTYFFDYKWTLKEFLTRKDGISSFTDEGSKWVNYCEHIAKAQKPQEPTSEAFADELRQKGLDIGNWV